MVSETLLDDAFAALASPTRRAIVVRLAQGEATVNELAEPFQLSLPAISKHIKVLEQAGLVTRTQYAQYRPCALNPVALDEIAAWTGQCRETWDARLDRMDDYLARLRATREGEHADE